MVIEHESIYHSLTCENCKQTFNGSVIAELHAEKYDHIVTGEVRYMVSFGRTGHKQVD